MNALAVIIGALIALLTGVVLARRSEGHERRRLLLSKLEELHIAADVTLAAHTASFAEGLAYLRFGTPHGEPTESKLAEIHALVALYFPELDPAYQSLDKATNDYVPLLLDAFARRPATKPEQDALAGKLTNAATLFHRAIRALQSGAQSIARNLMRPGVKPMTVGQRVVLVVGALLVIGMILYPPWVRRVEREGERLWTATSYSLIVSPPNRKRVRHYDYAAARRSGLSNWEIVEYLKGRNATNEPSLIERENYERGARDSTAIVAPAQGTHSTLGETAERLRRWSRGERVESPDSVAAPLIRQYVAAADESWSRVDESAAVRIDLVRLALQVIGVALAVGAIFALLATNPYPKPVTDSTAKERDCGNA